MLEELHIQELALIEEAWLEFSPGMTVLTGETGAGKTALLGGLKLLLGERADSGAVRSGAAEAMVEGRFSIDGEDVVARRRVGSDGRSRCTLNGEMATVGALSQTFGPLVDLHGQHEHQSLLSVSTHGGYLDRWAGESVSQSLSAYRAARTLWIDAVARRDAVAASIAQAARDSDYLRFVVEEIERVDPQVGEDELLKARLPALQHAEKLADAASQAAVLLRGDGGAFDAIARARESLVKVSGIDGRLDDIHARLVEIEALVDDAGVSARSYRDEIEDDPARLDATLARLGELSGLMKKYGPSLEGVLQRLCSARESLEVSQNADGALESLGARVVESEAALRDAASTLESARRAAAPGFTAALAEVAAELAMDGVHFEVAFHELPFSAWSSEGPNRIEFLFASTPSQPCRPLTRIASGGEISRVMLALKGVLGSADTIDTLVFDEIDAGIGGATATAVGRRLSQLAQTHQVVVVTHLAQVAAFADAHLVVSRKAADDGASTQVTVVSGDERDREIARMLSGNDSKASIAHAKELLGHARVR
ncbi:MAG: DNA repair protein RecN [Actinobacteria bacterium HGW-Actinobacteria-7]|nr:MAG: DNA repair protein RecN [Actinobacteria bacterium HGW-Actinobacteria-7]